MPVVIRKPLVLVVGSIFIIAAGLTGWLPGPGGIPLFLIGIAILSTEFEWAKRLRDKVMGWLRQFGHWYRSHKLLGGLIIVLIVALIISTSIVFYKIVA